MEKKKFFNSCILKKAKAKTSDKSADYYGFITLDREMVAAIVAQYKEHNHAAVNLSLYVHDDPKGKYTVVRVKPGNPAWKPTRSESAGESVETEEPNEVIDESDDIPF